MVPALGAVISVRNVLFVVTLLGFFALGGFSPSRACDDYQHLWESVEHSIASHSEGIFWQLSLSPILDDLTRRHSARWLLGFASPSSSTNERLPFWGELVQVLAASHSVFLDPTGNPMDPDTWSVASDSEAGFLWIDPQQERSERFFWRDGNNPTWSMFRIGSLDRIVYRALARKNDGDIVLIDEFDQVAGLEWDFHLTAHVMVGGVWLRRVAARFVGSSGLWEWMPEPLPTNLESLNSLPSGTHRIYLPTVGSPPSSLGREAPQPTSP
jgi:hypothetical protein